MGEVLLYRLMHKGGLIHIISHMEAQGRLEPSILLAGVGVSLPPLQTMIQR